MRRGGSSDAEIKEFESLEEAYPPDANQPLLDAPEAMSE
jgi:hypothetical protein